MKHAWYYTPLGWLLDAISRLPFGILYIISDLLYVIVYHIARYRRDVVSGNIRDSFPEKTEAERKQIIKEFYRHFTDYFVETIKLAHVSDSEMKRRMEFVGTDMIDRYFDEGRSLAMYFSHCGNWEWAPSITLWTRHKPSEQTVFAQVYRPLTNPWFDAYFLKLRSRFGSVSYDKRLVFRDLLRLKRDGKLSITGFMSDQKPSHNDTVHVVKFLNHPTAIITGTETIVRKLDLVAIYWDMEKVKRGHYRITARLISDNAAAMPQFEITDTYTRMLETTILRQPSIWLWSHRRWKNKVQYSDDNSHKPGNNE